MRKGDTGWSWADTGTSFFESGYRTGSVFLQGEITELVPSRGSAWLTVENGNQERVTMLASTPEAAKVDALGNIKAIRQDLMQQVVACDEMLADLERDIQEDTP